MPTIIQSIGVSGDFGQMSFNDPLDGVAFSSSGSGGAPPFSLSDLAQSIHIKEYETLKYKIGINKTFASTQYAMDISGDLRVDCGPSGDRQGGHIRVQPNTRNFPGPNKIVLYETPFGIGQTPTTSIGLGVDTDTMKFHTTSEYKWYYNRAGTWDYIKDASGNNISVGKMPTENGNLAMQLTDNDLSLNGNLTMHGNVALKIPVGTTAQRPTAINSTHAGYIRYNTTNSSFEGFGAGNSWGTLGGTKDVDQDTYITAENYAGADNDQLKFFTDNTLRMTVAKNGFVGIGISNPSVALDINGSIKFTGDMQVSGGIASEADFISQSNSTSHDLIFKAGTTERVRIKGDGKLGIGTDNPARHLHIHESSNSTNTYIQLTAGTTMGTSINNGFEIAISPITNDAYLIQRENNDLRFFTNNTEQMRIKNTGYIGIGSVSPQSLLDVNGSIRGGYNSNTTSYFGRAAVGYCGWSDYASFAHIDQNTTSNYALKAENNGRTLINCANGTGIHFRVSNSEKMTLESSGNLGIGTSNPSRLFHLHTNGNTYFQMTNTNTGTGNNDGFQFIVNSSKQAYITQREAADLIFDTSSSERMRLTASGNLGIGTSNPTDKLSVNGTIRCMPVGSEGGQIYMAFTGTATNKYWGVDVHSTNKFRIFKNDAGSIINALEILTNGNLGIGSTNPSVRLAIDSTDAIKIPVGTTAQRPTATGSSHYGYIRYNTSTSSYEGFGAGNAWGSLGGVKDVDQDTYISAETSAGADNDELKFFTAGTERVTIGNTGNVNIKNNLTVDGDFNITGVFNKTNTNVQVTDQIDISNNGTGPALIVRQHGTANVADFYDDTTLAMRIKNGGNIGIGTDNPLVTLQLGGNAQGKSTSGTVQASVFQVYDGLYRMETQSNQLAFRSQGGNGIGFYTTAETTNNIDNSKMIIKGSNVGIGTTGPTEKLHVEGNIKSSGWIRGGANTHTQSQFGYAVIGSKSYYNNMAYFGHQSLLNSSNNYAILQKNDGNTYINSGTDNKIYFRHNNTDKMIINNGKLGIGTDAPAMKLHLHETDVNNNTTLQISHNTTGSSGSDGFHLVVERTSNIAYLIQRENANMQFYTNNQPRMAIKSNGHVGIGTNNPSRQFHIHHSSAAYLQLTNDSTGTGDGDGFQITVNSAKDAFITQRHAANLVFNTNNAEKMRINSSGNVGINNTSPSYKLDVSGDVHLTGALIGECTYSKRFEFSSNNTQQIELSLAGNAGFNNLYLKVVISSGSGNSSASCYVHNYYQIRYWNQDIDANLIRSYKVPHSNYYIPVSVSYVNSGAKIKIMFDPDDGYQTTTEGFIFISVYSDGPTISASSHTTNTNTVTDNSMRTDTRIALSGKVGVGTAIPSKTLHVEGDMKLTDNLFLGTGSVSQSELGYLSGVTSSIQSQINSISSGGISLSLDGISDVKYGGTNFSSSLLIGSTNTGTLNNANNNVGIGAEVFNALTSGDANSALGYQSLKSNTTGYNNTAIGYQSLNANTTGYNNTATGYYALKENTTGFDNSAFGINTLNKNTTGYYNTAIGNTSLYANTTGNNNIATGYRTLRYNTTGNQNAAYGNNALYNNTTGTQNAAYGNNALYNNTTGDDNAASGYQALYSNTTGTQNTALGRSAGYTNTTGSHNTYVGSSADAGANNYSYSTALGFSAQITASNQIVLGRSSENVSIPGKLGIGTDNPSRNLHIHSSGTPYIQLTAGTSMGTGSNDGFQIGMWPSSSNVFLKNYEAGDIIFITNNDEKMRIKASDGNIGIGTNAPKSALHIFGNRANTTQVEGIHLGRTGSSGAYSQGMEFATSSGTAYIDFKKIGTGSADYHGRLLYNALDHKMEFYNNTTKQLTIDICGNLIYGTTSGNNRLDVLTDELRHFASEKHSFYYQPQTTVKYIKIDANGQSYPIHEVSLYQGTTDIAIGATTHLATGGGAVTQNNGSISQITDDDLTTSYRPDESANTNIWITLDDNIVFANLSALVIRALDRGGGDVYTKRFSQGSGTNGQMSFYDANSNLLWTAPAYQGNNNNVFHTVHVFALAQYNSSNFTTYSKNNTASVTASYSYTAPSLSAPAKVEQINFDKDTVNISGNLVVSGTTTTLNTTNTTISDSLIELSSGLTSAANNDAGIIIERGSTGNNAFMGWDESADKFVLGTTTATGSSSGNLSITKGDLDISNVSATSITLGGSDLQAQLTNLSSGGGSQWNTVNTNEIHYSSGNVGIGTNNPDSALHINANRNNNTQSEGIHFGRNANGSNIYDHAMEIVSSGPNSYIDFKNTTGNSDFDGRVLYNHTDNKLNFSTSNTIRMTLNTSGYLGIGTDSPDKKLDIVGTGLSESDLIRITNLTSGARAAQIFKTNNTSWEVGARGSTASVPNSFYIFNSGYRFIIDSTGNVSIGGNQNPSYKLDVTGDINFTGSLRQNGSIFSGGASELNALSDVKYEGSNFNKSLIIGNGGSGGNPQTGSLSSAEYNVGMGYHSLKSITSADYNTAIGSYSMKSITSGGQNAALGGYAMADAVSSQQCIAIGYYALSRGSSYDSTAVGAYSAPYVTSGRDLTAIGRAALYGVTSGSYNTGVGCNSIQGVTSGSYNTGMGKETGITVTTGSNNSFLGYQANVNATDSSYRTVIGSGASGTVNNSVTLGRSADIVTIPGKLGIGTNNPSTALQIGNNLDHDSGRAYDANALKIVHPTGTSNTVLNDPKPLLYLAREGTAGQAHSAMATFKLSRFENDSTHSKTRMDIDLTDGNFVDTNIMTLRADGHVGIGTNNPAEELHVEGHMKLTGSLFLNSGQAISQTEFGYLNGVTSDIQTQLNNISVSNIDISTEATPTASKATFGATMLGMSVTKLRIEAIGTGTGHWSLGHVDVFDFDGNNLVQTSNNGFTAKLFRESDNTEITASNYTSYGINGNWGRVGNIIADSLTNQLEYDGDQSNTSYWFVGLSETMYVEVYFPSGVTDINEITVGPWNQYSYADRFSSQTKITTFNGTTQLSTYTLPSASSYSYNFYVLSPNSSYSSYVTSLISNYPNSSYLTNIITDHEPSMVTNKKMLQLSDTSTTTGTINLIPSASGAKVGIGSTDPTAPLHIYKLSSTSTELMEVMKLETYSGTGDIGSNANALGGYIGLYANDDNAHENGEVARISWRSDNANNYEGDGRIGFWTSKATAHPNNSGTYTMTEKMTITRDGKVGIGDTAPSHTLDVTGDINFTGTLYQNGSAFSGGSSSQWSTVNTNEIHYSSGNVGIGTNNPTEQLDVRGNIYSTGSGQFTGGSFNTENSPPGVYLGALSSTYGNMQIISSNADGGWIDWTDNITGTHGDFDGRIRYGSGGTNFPGMNFYTNGNALRMLIDLDGNVGIGTNSPQQKLEVHGNILLGKNDEDAFIHGGRNAAFTSDSAVLLVADSNLTTGAGTNNSDLIFGYGSNVDMNSVRNTSYPTTLPRVETMRIKSSNSYVGIGIDNPTDKLHIYSSATGFDAARRAITTRTANNFNDTAGSSWKWISATNNSHNTSFSGLTTNGGEEFEQVGINLINYNTSGTGQFGISTRTKTGIGFSVRNLTTVHANALAISHAGNVGIGSVIPAYKLDVAGDINFTGTLRQNGSAFSGGASSLDGLSDVKCNVTNFTESLLIGHATTGTLNGANYNTGVGFNVFNALTTGDYNSAIGWNALNDLTTGSYNIAIGSLSLFKNTTGDKNTITGAETLRYNTTGSNNCAYGYQSLRSNTVSNNSAFGYQSLWANSTGASNTAVGYHALYTNTTGSANTATGHEALKSNTTASYNTAHGYQALTSNTTGVTNVAIGYHSLYSNTTGNQNTASGTLALFYNTTGSANTSFGYHALKSNTTGSYNTAVGNNSLKFNTTGSQDTAIGFETLYSNITGIDNTASGYRALYSNTSGHWNSAHGRNSLFYNTSGQRNAASGYESLFKNTTGKYNTGFGMWTLYENQTSQKNTAVGYDAARNTTAGGGVAVGADALKANTTGANNTAIGYNSGAINTTGGSNTYLGYNTNATANNLSNSTAIGVGATISASNQIRLGTATETVSIPGSMADTTIGSGVNTITPSGVADPSIQCKDIVFHNNSASDQLYIRRFGVGEYQMQTFTGTNNGDIQLQPYGGNVGIATTSPAATLDVNGSVRGAYDSNTTSYFGRAAIGHAGYSDWASFSHLHCASAGNYAMIQNGNGQTLINASSGQDLKFRINNNDKMIIKSDGYVGIGTSVPDYKLVVKTNVDYDGYILKNNSDNIVGKIAKGDLDGGYLNLYDSSGSAKVSFSGETYNCFINGGGKLGIGTGSPSAKLHLYESTGTSGGANGVGTLVLEHGNVGGHSSIVFASAKNRTSDHGFIRYQDDISNSTSSERAVLTIGTQNDGDDHIALMASGHVGIGKNNPSYDLDVNGNINFTGTLYQNGSAFSGGGGGASSLNGLSDCKTWATNSILIGNTTTGTLNAANYNTGVGINVFNALTTADYNTAVGQEALKSVTTGGYNTAVGHRAGRLLTTATQCIAIGYNALDNGSGINSVAVGAQSQQKVTSGNSNTTIGTSCFHNITTGSENTGSGNGAGYFVTTGSSNTIFGKNTGQTITTGSNNSIFGKGANVTASSSSYRTVIGAGASGLVNNSVTLGRGQDIVRVPGDLQVGTDGGTAQTFINEDANYSFTGGDGTGSSDTFVASNTDLASLIVGEYGTQNSTFRKIGSLSTDGGSSSNADKNQAVSAYFRASIIVKDQVFIHSDSRIKTNTNELNDNSALIQFRKLKPCTYNYVDTFNRGDKKVFGYIAQEVADVIPEAVSIKNDFIPNILCNVDVDISNNYLTASNIDLGSNPYNLKTNFNDLSLNAIDSSGNQFAEINIHTPTGKTLIRRVSNIINNTTIEFYPSIEPEVVLDPSSNNFEAFVQGQKVNDFHTLDKNSIFTLASSALQEVDRQQQADKTEISNLKTQVATLENKVQSLETQMATVLQRLQALENP